MPTRYIMALDAAGDPITGATPAFQVAFDASTLLAVAPLPAITEVGNGIYTFEAGNNVTGLVLVDGTSVPRYAFVRPELNNVFPVYDTDGLPQTGLTPTMVRRVASTGAGLGAIAITELGGGLYGFVYPDPSEEQIVDIDTGGDGPPQLYLSIGLSSTTAPVISGISPAAGTSITTFQSIQFDVTDAASGEVQLALITVKFAAKRDVWMVYDGTDFTEQFIQNSTVTAIANGLRFSVRPKGGWQDSIDEFFVYAVDGDGNVEALPA